MAGIVLWDGLLALAVMETVPALVIGNCFILKPSEKIPFAVLAFDNAVTWCVNVLVVNMGLICSAAMRIYV
jgi:acyl-CoA reductase-like NAD-dependent aldehyde dehydrogenase